MKVEVEALGLEERASLAIRVGESHFREFKSAFTGEPGSKTARAKKDVATDIARTLVAFANADGGEVLIGVEDDATVTGLPYAEDEVEFLKHAPVSHVHRDTPLPPVTRVVVQHADRRILYFQVAKGLEFVYLTADGRCIRREDRRSVPDTAERILHSREEDRSRLWDRSFSHGASLKDLDVDLLDSISSQIAYGVSPEKLLQYFDLAEFTPGGLQLRNAALVLFGKDIRKWHPRCQVRIMTVRGRERLVGADYNVVKDDVVSDNIVTLVETAWERLTVALAQQPTFTETARFEQNYLYPQLACREALLNAIVHRDYAVEGRGIEIAIYSDRMEILSPGRLLSTVNLEDLIELKGVHESRNPLIARLLREVGLVREMGEGLVRVFEVMRSHSLAKPELQSTGAGFSVDLFNKSMYDDDVSLWLSKYDNYQLTEAQKAVMVLGYGGQEFSAQDAIDTLGIVDATQLQVILTPLRNANLIERTKDHNRVRSEAKKSRIPTRKIKSYRVIDRTARDLAGGSLSNAEQASVTKPSPAAEAEVTGDAHQSELTSAAPGNHSSLRTHSLFVGNIPTNLTESELTAFLNIYADVEGVRIPPGQKGDANRGFAFVDLRTPYTVQEVIRVLDQKMLGGRRLRVSPSRRP